MTMNKIIKIYKITNTCTKKCYVGQTKNKVSTRFSQHSKANSPLGLSIRKYGKEKFFIEQICSCLSQEEADIMEEYFITKFNSCGKLGYNQTKNGRGSFNQDMYGNTLLHISRDYCLNNFTRTELGYLFDIIRNIDDKGRIKYGRYYQQYCRKWKDLEKVLKTSYNTIRKSFVLKLKKANIIQYKNNTLYFNDEIAYKEKEYESIKLVMLKEDSDIIIFQDLTNDLIYKCKIVDGEES